MSVYISDGNGKNLNLTCCHGDKVAPSGVTGSLFVIMRCVCVPALIEGVYLDPVVCVFLQDLPGVLVSVE